MAGVETPYAPTQEMRFALVLYGGVSLAIYINGVVQEFLHLVRATAPNAPTPTGETALLHGEELKSTESIYRELGQLARFGEQVEARDTSPGDPILTRFVVDVLSGSSAGGINGIFLAKALAHELEIDELSRLWVEQGDIDNLVNDRQSLDGVPLLELVDPPVSLLNSRRMYWQILNALDGMGGDDGEHRRHGLATGRRARPLGDADGHTGAAAADRSDGQRRLREASTSRCCTSATGRHTRPVSARPEATSGGASTRSSRSPGAPRRRSHSPSTRCCSTTSTGRSTRSSSRAATRAAAAPVPTGPRSSTRSSAAAALALPSGRSRTCTGPSPSATAAISTTSRSRGRPPHSARRRADLPVDRRLIYIEPDPGGLAPQFEDKPPRRPPGWHRRPRRWK